MSSSEYVPPKVWTWDESTATPSGNRPDAGARTESTLPVGKHPLQLYSMATPNGQKASIMLEELLEAGVAEAEYDAWPINIGKGDQFGSGFVELNPNSKIPALVDKSGEQDINIFESGSILLHLAEKFGLFIPKDPIKKVEMMNWLFWQVGSAPYVGGGFGHFYKYASVKYEYPINRFTMETKRQLDVLDKHLADNKYMVGDQYTIADIAIFTWYGGLALGQSYGPEAAEFLQSTSYSNLKRWAEEIAARPAVIRGRKVNKFWGDKSDQLHERHDASDFELKTQDKLDPQ